MAGRTSRSSSHVADPVRRAYLSALRTIRTQVLKEHEKEIAETGFFGRLFVRLRIEREIRRRTRDLTPPHRR